MTVLSGYAGTADLIVVSGDMQPGAEQPVSAACAKSLRDDGMLVWYGDATAKGYTKALTDRGLSLYDFWVAELPFTKAYTLGMKSQDSHSENPISVSDLATRHHDMCDLVASDSQVANARLVMLIDHILRWTKPDDLVVDATGGNIPFREVAHRLERDVVTVFPSDKPIPDESDLPMEETEDVISYEPVA